jgi:hypothetical protein
MSTDTRALLFGGFASAAWPEARRVPAERLRGGGDGCGGPPQGGIGTADPTAIETGTYTDRSRYANQLVDAYDRQIGQ